MGIRTPGQHRHFVYNAPVEHSGDRHEIDNLRGLLAPLDIRSESVPRIDVEAGPREEPYWVLHLFPGGYRAHYKAWSRRNWIELIDRLTARGIHVQLSGAPVDAHLGRPPVGRGSAVGHTSTPSAPE